MGLHRVRALVLLEWGFSIATKDADHVDLYTGITANGELDKRLAARGLGALSYYDASPTRMFSLNRTVREACERRLA